MKYSAAVLSMAAVAVARPAFTTLNFDVTEGQPFTLEFTGCEGGCTIELKNGDRGDLKDVRELTSSAEGGSFTFTLDSVPSDTYTFEIVNNETGEDNYSQQFQFEGEAAEPTTTAETETITSSIVETLTSSTPETTVVETVTSTASSTEDETSSMTTPSGSASTTVTETQTSTATDEASSTTDGAESTSTSDIPDPEAAAIALGSPMTLVVAAVAGLLMFN